MRRSERLGNKVPDFKILNQTGELVWKSSENQQSQEDLNELSNVVSDSSYVSDDIPVSKAAMNPTEEIDVVTNLEIEESLLSDEISDFIEENPADEHGNCIEDIDSSITKVEDFRKSYRRKHKELQNHLKENYEERYGKLFAVKIEVIKAYIMKLKNTRKAVRGQENLETKETLETKERKTNFLMDEIERMMASLYVAFTLHSNEKDEEIKRRKKELPEQLKEMQLMAAAFKDLMGTAPVTGSWKAIVSRLNARYENLVTLKTSYVSTLNNEVEEREIDKKENFNASILNIKLSKFKGYNSDCDIYTFQNDFEKLYAKSTPKSVLPDLLKNNFLENPALLLVRNVNGIDEIWKRLKEAYGDHQTMLSKKLAEFGNIEATWKHRDSERVAEGLSKIINIMKDLMQLSKKHHMENKLFHSDALEKIYQLLGDSRMTRWLSINCDNNAEGEPQWNLLINFLEKEVKVNQQKSLIQSKVAESKRAPPTKGNRHLSHFASDNHDQRKFGDFDRKVSNYCFICGDSDHVLTNGPGGSRIVQYFVCKRFVEMSPAERFAILKSKGFCFQCLFPGAEWSGKHKEGRCQRDYACKHPSHSRYLTKKHVLVCDEHKDTEDNKILLHQYKSRCILKQADLPLFTKELSFHVNVNISQFDASDEQAEINDKAIYMLQTIEVDGNNYSLFYDTGCGDFIARYDAVKHLGHRVQQECSGPITLGGVGGITTETPHGIYSVKLPLGNGGEAMMSGICMNQITTTLPTYPISGKVETDIKHAYVKAGGNVKNLPALPKTVGGDIDFMFGIKYLKYFPEKIYQMASGLTIYKSQFKNADGSYGVIGGPHKIFTKIEKYHHLSQSKTFLCNQYHLFKIGYQVNPDVSLLGFKDTYQNISTENDENSNHSNTNNCMQLEIPYQAPDYSDHVYLSRQIKLFNQAETVGSEINYRCVKCRSCAECKNHDIEEALSIREEVEQDLINRSVVVDINNCVTTAKLPFMHDPTIKLSPNRNKALKVYYQQLKRLTKNSDDRDAIIQSEKKLQDLGFVEYIKNLPPETQTTLSKNPIQNYIPWRVVWKESSTSTPCRVVFDASQSTDSGYSLNDIIAKGRNNMNKLLEVFIRWRSHHVGFHTDIQKMYNAIKLQEGDWCLQRYLWQNQLDINQLPEEKVIKTLIYGVKSSGNQAEHGLRETAAIFKDKYPEVHETVSKDIYVDDCISGCPSMEQTMQRTDQLELVLNRGGFTLKGITISGNLPIESLSSDGVSVSVAGLKWYPKDDQLALDIKDLNFAKKCRGRKPIVISDVPAKLTRRDCTSKVAEIFDLSGMLTPITATMKLDLHNLVTRKLDWDATLPDNLRNIWISHFDMISEIKNIRYQRAIVPVDAESLDLSTLDFGDASQSLVCASIYARFKRTTGEYSCQLIFARSRLVPDGMSQPRAELYAALVNTHAGEVIRKAFYKTHKKTLKFTDSQIVLHWIGNQNRSLKQWVRNRVIEIQRYTEISSWKYVRSENMIADIGTRRCTSLNEVKADSVWVNGLEWMRKEESHFPMMTLKEVTLNNQEIQAMKIEVPQEVALETPFKGTYHLTETTDLVPADIAKRYQFSNYVIDPNKHRWKTVVRILAIVMRFINKLRLSKSNAANKVTTKTIIPSPPKLILFLSDEEIEAAERYFFLKATDEIKQFLKPNQYKSIGKEVNGILFYTGRILPTDSVTIVGNATQAMKDLSSTTFCVPLVDRNSPIAYSIVNEFHWHNPSIPHSGIETTWRHVLKKIFIIEGRFLVKKIKKSCERCRYLEKRTLDVIMGPVSKYNLTIAPAYYNTQVDLCGPFQAYSQHHKRTTIKIWLIVFCCCATTAVNIKVMDDYSTTAFLQAFTRFSCEVGYPKLLLPDEGSQLVKGCESMKLSFVDIKYQLNKDVAVQFETCPVGGHNMHGKVERKIRQIKVSLEKTLLNERLSIMRWETIAASIANSINNLPLALGNVKSDFEAMDLITPNRLCLGRNNDRSPIGCVRVTNDYDKILRENEKVFNSWFEIWLQSHVPKLMDHPKWFRSDVDLKEGDMVLFLKQESALASNYQFGIVNQVERGRDGMIRRAKIRYRNNNEETDRETYRSVRSLVVIHRVDELNLMNELWKASEKTNLFTRGECCVITCL